MNLLELKAYLMKVRMASLASLAVCFNADADNIRQMLNHWINKGCVRKCARNEACAKTCGKCVPTTLEIYEWVG